MPNIIVISGIIGLEVLADEIRDQLNDFNGEPVEIEINSPGGLVVDGIEIFNLLRMYKGKVKARIMGLAGSMASIIPMAADEIEVFENSVFFIHLALSTIRGNKNILRNEADILDGFDQMLIGALAKKSGKKRKDLEALMEKETFFFGENIKNEGFADILIESDEPAQPESEVIANAKAQFYACKEKIKDIDPKLDKIAAYLNFQPPVKRPATSNIQTEVKRMDKKQIKAEYPDVYESILEDGRRDAIEALKDEYIAEGKASGILAERARISGIEALAMPNDFTAKAKSENWTVEQSAAEYLRAEAEKRKEISNKMENEIPEPLESDAPTQPKAPEAKKDVDHKEEFEAKVKSFVDGGMKRTEAIKAAAKANPDLHQNYINSLKGGK